MISSDRSSDPQLSMADTPNLSILKVVACLSRVPRFTLGERIDVENLLRRVQTVCQSGLWGYTPYPRYTNFGRSVFSSIEAALRK